MGPTEKKVDRKNAIEVLTVPNSEPRARSIGEQYKPISLWSFWNIAPNVREWEEVGWGK